MTAPNSLQNRPITLCTIDELLGILSPLERFLRLVYLDFGRSNGRFVYKRLRFLPLLIAVFALDILMQLTEICQRVKEARLSEAQQAYAVACVEFVSAIRGLSILLKAQDIFNFSNKLDQIFPRDYYLQERLSLPKVAMGLKQRFRILNICASVALAGFTSIPLAMYLLSDVDRSLPVADKYHQNLSWAPFGIKQDHRLYPYIYAFEYLPVMIGYSFVMTWDRTFTVFCSLLTTHFEFLNSELLKLDARCTVKVSEAEKFNKHLKELLAYQQHLNHLGQEFNDIFKMSIFASDSMCAIAVCFHFYLVLNTDNVLDMMTFLLPALTLIGVTFNVCQQATHLETAASNIAQSLYNHNWYEGSLAYRRHVSMWMRHTYVPLRFHGFERFEMNMAHFQQMMTMTYQMLTFLQSVTKKN